jgi:hypothetical protein
MLLLPALAVLLIAHTSAEQAAPTDLPAEHAWGCRPGNISAHMKFCDRTAPVADRVADLLVG